MNTPRSNTPSSNESSASRPRHKRSLGIWIAGGIGVGIIAFIIDLLFKAALIAPQMRFNPWALLSLACIITSISALIFLTRLRLRSDEVTWLSLYIATVCLWATAEFFQRLTTDASTAMFWWAVATPSASYMASMLCLFAVSYTNPTKPRPLPLIVILFIAPLFITLLDLRSWLIGIYDGAHLINNSWGLTIAPGPYFSIIGGWITSLFIVSLSILIYHYYHTPHPILRRQTRLFIIAVASTTVLGGITDAILPSFGIVLPPLAVLTSTMMGILICYGTIRYRLFTFTSLSIATNILETMNEAVLTTDKSLAITYANAGAERLLGHSKAAFMHMHFGELLRPHWTPNHLQTNLIKPLSTQARHVIENVSTQSATGDIISVKLAVSTAYNDSNQKEGYIITLADITKLEQAQAALKAEKQNVERKVIERTQELHNAQTKLNASIESLSVGFMIIDPDQKITLKNSAMDKILGLKPATPLTLADVAAKFTDLSNADTMSIQKAYESHKVTETSGIVYGSKILHSFMAPVIAKDASTELLGTVVLLEDTTEQVVLDRSKDEFFSIASHELRTPLTAIRGNASMMLSMYKEVLKHEDMEDMVEDIHQSSMRLIDIVNDFLDVSRIEQGKIAFTYEDVALDQIIETTIYEMRAVLQEKHLSLNFNKKTLDELPKVWADKNRLKQIIYNMVGNAAKFTDQGGITINATAKGDFVKVSVTDTGRGISLENQRLLFHKFQQAGGSLITRDTTRGTGLGLYISKMLIENMGGRMALESSAENHGSTFTVTIPMANGKQAATATTPVTKVDTQTGLTHVETLSLAADTLAKPASGKSKTTGRLLIIEDDPYVLRMYGRIFNADLLNIKTALNGQLGYTTAQEFQPDLILLDVMMPIMNGIEALDALKSNATTKNIPVIMLSSLGEEDMVKQALAKGAAAYLVKSDFAPEQLQQEIQKRLSAITQKPS